MNEMLNKRFCVTTLSTSDVEDHEWEVLKRGDSKRAN